MFSKNYICVYVNFSHGAKNISYCLSEVKNFSKTLKMYPFIPDLSTCYCALKLTIAICWKWKGTYSWKLNATLPNTSLTIRDPWKIIRALATLAKRWKSPWQIQKKKYIFIEKMKEWGVLTWRTDQKRKVTESKRKSSQMLPVADKESVNVHEGVIQIEYLER